MKRYTNKLTTTIIFIVLFFVQNKIQAQTLTPTNTWLEDAKINSANYSLSYPDNDAIYFQAGATPLIQRVSLSSNRLNFEVQTKVKLSFSYQIYSRINNNNAELQAYVIVNGQPHTIFRSLPSLATGDTTIDISHLAAGQKNVQIAFLFKGNYNAGISVSKVGTEPPVDPRYDVEVKPLSSEDGTILTRQLCSNMIGIRFTNESTNCNGFLILNISKVEAYVYDTNGNQVFDEILDYSYVIEVIPDSHYDFIFNEISSFCPYDSDYFIEYRIFFSEVAYPTCSGNSNIQCDNNNNCYYQFIDTAPQMHFEEQRFQASTNLPSATTTINGIIVAGNNNSVINISNGTTVKFNASKYIELYPGFNSDLGSIFSANIELCETNEEPPQKLQEGNSKHSYKTHSKKPKNKLFKVKNLPNYYITPNPFYNNINISYTLSRRQKVDIIIYNYLGQKVAHPIQEEQQLPNTYQVSFNASHLPNGIYYCELKYENQKTTKQLVKF